MTQKERISYWITLALSLLGNAAQYLSSTPPK